MTKKEWLQERVSVDRHGKPYTLSDTYPLDFRYMVRSEAYKKQGLDDKQINELYRVDIKDLEMLKEKVYC